MTAHAHAHPSRRPATLNRRAALELAAIALTAALVLGLVVGNLVREIREEHTPSSTTLAIGVLGGIVLAAIPTIGVFFGWRHSGGRPAQHLGRAVWRTGQLPACPEQRSQALRDLRRRDRRLQQRSPATAAGTAGVFAILGAIQIWINHSWPNIVVWVAIFALYLSIAVIDRLDRQRRPELHRLIEALEDSTGADVHLRAMNP